jgi:hypothetical protein
MKNQFIKHQDYETLERIKRWPSMKTRFKKVRIYSAEHGAFWRNTGQGYTLELSESSIWDMEEAVTRTYHCGPEKMIQFISADKEPEESLIGSSTGSKSKLQELIKFIQKKHSNGNMEGYSFGVDDNPNASLDDYAESILNLLKLLDGGCFKDMTEHISKGGADV